MKILPASLLLFFLFLAGCTTGNHHADSTATDNHTLRVALNVEPSTLDPAKTPDLYTSELLMHFFDGLVRYNARNQIEPMLAEKWEISPDGKVYTFHLRANVTFHNGRPFVADDVKYSWERALNKKTASPVAATYLDGVLGAKDLANGKRADLPGVEVVDPHTLRVTLDRPRAYFLGMLSYPSNFIVCKEAVEKNGGVIDAQSLVGTGPYTLESYRPGYNMTLKAYANYWQGTPKMARIEEPIIIDPDTLYNNFDVGKVDVWQGPVPFARYAQDRDAKNLQAEYKLLPAAQVDYLVMHPGLQPVFAKKEVRQAFAMAIDRDNLIKVAYKNVAHRADGMLPPELKVSPNPEPIPYDPSKAKQLLAQAGYPDGKGFPALTLTTLQKTPYWQEACEIIRKNLRDNLGITVNLEVREAGEYWDAANREKMEFFLTGWIADYPDPQDFLSTLFASDASLNHVKYKNSEFDTFCVQADQEKDTAKRNALYSQANRQLMQDVGVLPIAFSPRIGLIHTNVQGWQANLCSYLPHNTTTKTTP